MSPKVSTNLFSYYFVATEKKDNQSAKELSMHAMHAQQTNSGGWFPRNSEPKLD